MAFIDQFDVVLLDMGDTFMFDLDNFSPDQDFFQTYRDMGGKTLSAGDLRRIMLAGFEQLSTHYENPRLFESFPRSIDVLQAAEPGLALPDSEWSLLDRVFARHECGAIPKSHADAVRELGRTHTLGLISNIWAPSANCLAELQRAGLLELFHAIVYSSDWLTVKPFPRLFEIALAKFDAPSSRMVFVGDSLRRDIAGAREVGLSTVWIQSDQPDGDPNEIQPDRTISDLRELPHA